jgi:hypothetical protein
VSLKYLLLIVAAAVIVYGQSLRNPFVIWDDDTLVYGNPVVQEFSVTKAFTSYDPELYIPLTLLTYQIEYAIAGATPLLYHVTNLLLFMGCGVLIFLLCRQWSGNAWIATALSLLFIVHPINTEAVAWVSARKDLLAGFFGLAAMLLWRYNRWLSLTAFLLALFSKSSVIPLPLVLLLLDWAEGRDIKVFAKKLLPLFGLSILFTIIALLGKTKNIGSLTVVQTMLLSAKSFVTALAKYLWPFDLSSIYHQASAIGWSSEFLIALGICVALLIAIFLSLRRTKIIAISAAIFILMLAPSFANFWKDGELHYFSDRYILLAQLGIFFLMAKYARVILTRTLQKIVAGVFAVLLIPFGFTAHARAHLWGSSEALFRDALKKNDRSALLHFNLGVLEHRRGNLEAAFGAYQKTLRLDPRFAKAYANIGAMLLDAGKTNEAIVQFRAALEIDPTLEATRKNLEKALF